MESDQEDDWLFDSIRKYKSLYMYNLQKPVHAADWITEESVAVCISDNKTHEVLELSLPAQLCVEESNSGLTKDRDFELIAGGFSERCMSSLQHLQHSPRRVVASVKGDNCVEVWQLHTPDNNLTKRVAVIENKVSSCVPARLCVVNKGHLLFASHLSSVCLADLESSAVVLHITAADGSPDCPLSSLVHVGGVTWTCDPSTGQLFLIDTRVGTTSRQGPELCGGGGGESPGEGSQSWTLCGDLSGAGQCLVTMSNSGRVCVRDVRSVKECVMSVSTSLRCHHSHDITISMSPTETELLAVTGFSDRVQLFDRSGWTDGCEASPVFVHDGHWAERIDQSQDIITNIHLWYPWKHKTLLSASSDGGLHIFQPVL